ncbi:phage virion morphogenesis protein [Shewanella fidelis]|uniref:Phage virion morphogenesis protein n=1 Tax=Shewanella fidelis TaxID=173509 RepID=A0AAW8NMQ7_9GAMM|nr:phage virion morphogenesis protein [Shewanella fidelis]MDR8523466.1 phage virion morphogenesis protein [Shewanella fidelis]MDW4813301.1 phage virion morphogenesis protein [Shewanella fidelis]MDW4817328.1 phage virion morphogenesis protein [Shewanella fidelis]MDW4821316.1 phage virion morphogenesis protein [Shewanella fidelis]MDW4824606.1 phage virion morphogenesis protein [Shewanella fidelis]
MAGSRIEINTKGDRAISEVLQQLIEQSQDLTPALHDIGEYLLETHQQRFIDQQTPDGTPWEPLSPTTLARKRRGDRILIEEGNLANNLHYQILDDGLEFGSNEVYAAMHQFGGTTSPQSMMPNQEIPAREFLGLADEDEQQLLQLLSAFLVD